MFTVDNIDPMLCTHLVYAFAFLNKNRNAIESASPEYDLEENDGEGAYRKITSLKKDFPHLKILLAVGGVDEIISKDFSEVAESPSRRKALVGSVSEYLRKYNFDGLVLYWLYPAEQNGVPADKQNFVSLLKEFREEFDKFGLLLTAPLKVMPDMIEHSYDIPAVSQYLHYMFALCFAYYGWMAPTGLNAPLYPRYDDDKLNVESSINTLLFNGADRNKLVLGLPLFGNRLKNTEGSVGIKKVIEGAGLPGSYGQESGFFGYNEICWEVDNPTNNWKKYWDNVTHTPYATKDNQFVSYDDTRSLTDKVELAVRKHLAGVAVFYLEEDDFHGICTFGRSGSTGYPLMRAINSALYNSVSWEKVPCPSRSSARGPVH
jgi:chitinase